MSGIGRQASLVVVMILVSGAGRLFAAETEFKNLPSDYKPGQLKLPLTVTERSGVERKGVVVSSGVPFPPGFLSAASKLAVVDEEGKPVVSQATRMLTWHKPAYDDSVQWALVSFTADVPANGTSTYFLTDDGKSAAPASPLKLNRTAGQIVVDTGSATFMIPEQGSALIAKATIGGTDVLGAAGLVPTITAGDWADRSLKDGQMQTGGHDAAGVNVEESGPARVVVAIKGGFAPGDRDKRFYDYTARMYFTAGSPAVRVIYTISNGHLDPAFYPTPDGKGKSRFAYVWPITDASLVADVAFGRGNVCSLAEDKLVSMASAGDAMTIFQSGGGYKINRNGEKELAAGSRHLGVLDVNNNAAGITVAARYFAEQWPGVMTASANRLRLGLLPAESGQPFSLNHGQRKSWDIRLTLHGAGPVSESDLKARFNEQDALLLFRPDPAWMVWAAGETGSWSAGLALGGSTRRVKGMRRNPAKTGQPGHGGTGGWVGDGGWARFGEISSWNAGGTHWNEQTAFFNWVIHGNGAEFDHSEIPTLWAADLCPIHFDNPDMDVYFPYTGGGQAQHCRLKVLTFPGCRNQAPWGRPDSGHMGMWMWAEYYMLTGDARCREAVCHLGDMARGCLWRYTHEERKDGTGALSPGQFHPFKKFDPDAEPDFKLDRRYVGWPLYCLAQYYQFTGDPALLEEGRIVAGGFRNTARACPIGQLVTPAAGKNGTEKTEYSATFGFPHGNGGVASQVREWPKSASLVQSNFYSGIVIYGLREYYLVSHDIEALDTLVGQIDRFCHYSLIHDPRGEVAGWTYIFADYWGPYTWEDSFSPKSGKSAATLTGTNALTSDALAGIYPLTGRADLLDVMNNAVKQNVNNNLTIAVTMVTAHPKTDQVPPPAVRDLAVEPLGGGKVRLTWTAPADAAWYQMKYTTAEKMVERVTGWPDRTDPLPGTRKEYDERAAAFNASQRSFWASYNVPGEPKPGQAGARETMIVEGLPAGPLNFALKSWDTDDNISDLSNVARAEVK